LIKSKDFNTN